jgi:hypothetical protein
MKDKNMTVLGIGTAQALGLLRFPVSREGSLTTKIHRKCFFIKSIGIPIPHGSLCTHMKCLSSIEQ